MYRLMRIPFISRILSLCTLVAFIFMTSSCHFYFRVNRSEAPPADVIREMKSMERFIILHDGDDAFGFTNIHVSEQAITGEISVLEGHRMYTKVTDDKTGPYRYRVTRSNNEKEVLNEVHIYVSEINWDDQVHVSVPVSAVQKIDVYDKATGAIIASWTVGIILTAAAIYGIFVIILLLTKSSCPFIYGFDGSDYIFCGEVFSGSVQPGLERDDYFPLPLNNPAGETYKIKIANEVKEIQFVNQAELIVVDHKKESEILFDKYGTPHSFDHPAIPVSAGSGDTDIFRLISMKDSLSYTGLEKVSGDKDIEEIYLKFVKPENVKSARLILRAKNSFWMETVISEIHELFGDKYNTFVTKQEEKSGQELSRYQLEQEMPLSVYLENNRGWKFIDYFNLPGAMAIRNDILPINLESHHSDTISIKLRTGFGFWEVDYLAMDFGPGEDVTPVKIQAKSAVCSDSTDQRTNLSSSDDHYYILEKPGDEAFLEFENPEMKAGRRSVFLHARGYYKILREPAGPTDKKTLKALRKPGAVPAFSKELYEKSCGI